MRYVILVLLLLLSVSGVAAQTPTITPEGYYDPLGVIDESVYTPQFTYDTEAEVMADLGVSDAYQFSMLGAVPSPFDAESLGDTVIAQVSLPRSSTNYKCTQSDGTLPSNVTGLEGVAGTWTYQQYKTCNGLNGTACAVVIQQMAWYSYTYSDLGRGSSMYISYISFEGAQTGDPVPVSNTFLPKGETPRWYSYVYYKTNSAREARPGVELTPLPSGGWVKLTNPGGLWHPMSIFRSQDPGITGRYYIQNISNTQIGAYAVQIGVPAVIARTFKPRVNVCAVRPSAYDPVKAATSVAQATNAAKTATRLPDKPATIIPTPPSATNWNVNIQRMWENGREYFVNMYHPNLSLAYLNFYGAAGTTPTDVVTGIHVRVYQYDSATKRVGSQVYSVTYTCPRGQWCTWSLAQLKQTWPTFNTTSYIATVSCPAALRRICPPTNATNNFDSMWSVGAKSDSLKAANSIFSLDPKTDLVFSFPGTATAYVTLKTPTRTIARTHTPVPTTSPIATARTNTPILNVTTTAQRQTATAQAAAAQQTATAHARVVATATSFAATSVAQQTRAAGTATAQIVQTQTVQAQITSVINVTETAIANWIATQQATQQVYIDTTKTAQKLADDGDAVFRPNIEDQNTKVDEVADEVGPGEVIQVLIDATDAFDDGLNSTPCNGFPEELGGYLPGAGAYQISDDLAASLCDIRNWLDSDETFVPFVRLILSVILTLIIAVTVLRSVRGASK